MAGALRRHGRIGGMALLALVGALLVSVGWHVPVVSASSAGSVQIVWPVAYQGNYSGPVDTAMSLAVYPAPSATQPQSYQLRVLTSTPTDAACASAPVMPGVAQFTLDPSAQVPTAVNFHWPARFGKGKYWFCATPVDGSGAKVTSAAAESFTVLTDTAPSVKVDQPYGVFIRTGDTITVTLTGWTASDNQDPQLLASVGPIAGLQLPNQSVNEDLATKTYTITTTIPADGNAGTYTITAQGECGQNQNDGKWECAVSEASQPFKVIAGPIQATPTTPPTPTTTPATNLGGHFTGTPGASANGSDSITSVLPILVAEGIAALLLFGVAANLYRRQRRALRAAEERRRAWGTSPGESDHFRVEALPRRTMRR